jgi:hypothetical protein
LRVATCFEFFPLWRWIPIRIRASRRESESESIVALVGMLKRTLNYENSAVSIRLKHFGLALRSSPPFLSRSNQLIFLCGANRSDGVPSARREAIKKFIESLSEDLRVIYAEGVFSELSKIGHNKNVLDLEHEISDMADKILIVLESYSAFCELGAFAHKSYREKLFIINDSKFELEKSFINVGPIAAAIEANSPVVWYPMLASGIHHIDGIGATFKALKDAVSSKPILRSYRVHDDLSKLKANKVSLYFVHDIVLIAGPVSHKEIIAVLEATFGKNNFDMLKHLLGVLRAAELVRSYDVCGEWVYQSVIAKPFMRYQPSIAPLMATFRHFHLRTNPARFGIA